MEKKVETGPTFGMQHLPKLYMQWPIKHKHTHSCIFAHQIPLFCHDALGSNVNTSV